MTYFLIYLFVMVGQIGAFLSHGWLLFSMGLAALIICVLAAAWRADDSGPNMDFKHFWENHGFIKVVKRPAKLMMIFGFILGTLGNFTPSQKDLAIIIGSGVTYEALTSETGKRIGGKSIELLEKKIDEALESVPAIPEKPKQEKPKTNA